MRRAKTILLAVAVLALFVAPASAQAQKHCSQCNACDDCSLECYTEPQIIEHCGDYPLCRHVQEWCSTTWCATVPADTPCTPNDGICAATTCGAIIGEPPVPPGGPGEPLEIYHQDALGSVRLVTNEQGQVIARHDYLPFGEEIPTEMGRPTTAGYGPFDATPQRFTGKERDTESNLDYFGARYYSGAMGRFTSADPDASWGSTVPSPQRWNRYVYVSNNPVRKVDPNGEKEIDLPIGVATGYAKTVAMTAFGMLMMAVEYNHGYVDPYTTPYTWAAMEGTAADAKLLHQGVTHPGDVVDQYVDMAVSNNDADQRALGEAFGSGGAVATMVMAPFAEGVVRPAAAQPVGGAGVVLADGTGATHAEMAASAGGPTAGQRVSSSLRQQTLAETPAGQPYGCWRCGQTSANPADMHVGHRNLARSRGGNLSRANVCLEGAACNLSAGNRGAPSPGMSCAERGSCGAPYGR